MKDLSDPAVVNKVTDEMFELGFKFLNEHPNENPYFYLQDAHDFSFEEILLMCEPDNDDRCFWEYLRERDPGRAVAVCDRHLYSRKAPPTNARARWRSMRARRSGVARTA